MTNTHEDERPGDADPIDDEARDDDDGDWPQPLSSEERSRIEAETWNWNAVKVYPGGQGPGVPFAEYARSRAAADAAAEAAETTSDPDVADDTAASPGV